MRTLGERPFEEGLMELEIERKLREIRYENHKFKVQFISAMAAVAGVAVAFGIAIGWCARGGPLGGI